MFTFEKKWGSRPESRFSRGRYWLLKKEKMRKDVLIRRRIPAVLLFLFYLWSSPPARGGQTGPAEPDLASILCKTAEYCRKLEASVLDFFCREEVRETIDWTRELKFSLSGNSGQDGIVDSAPQSFSKLRMTKNQFVYDYQCVRAGGRLKEKRILIEFNGEKRNEPVAAPRTNGVAYDNPFLCPVVLFSKNNQNSYDFRIAGTDRIEKKDVIVVEAVPKASGDGSGSLFLSGKAWIDPETAEIRQIELTQKRAAWDEIFARREIKIGGELRLTTRAEFKTENNGFLFPCTLTIEESYLVGRHRTFKRSTTRVDFTDFKFFTVDVDVRSD